MILTTHVLEVAERLADRIGIITQRQAWWRKAVSRNCATMPGKGGTTLEDVFLHLTAEPSAAEKESASF